MHRSMSFRRRLAGAAALSLSLVLLAGPAFGQSGGAPEISVPAAPLGEALKLFSEQSGIAVVFTETLVQGKMSAGTGGALEASAALTALLLGTGLEAVAGGDGYVIRARPGTPGNNPPPVRTAPVRTPADAVPSKAGLSEAEQRLGQVTVTGTSLRGIAPESSPLQIYSRADILGSGVTTTEQFIRTLPQNFGGGSSEFAAVIGLPNDANSQFNSTFGTSANLRGLGSRGTLTLLNGNRMAPTSELGDFVDISMIPLSAIARVDVLTDGASSIYGGDAVAGVMNFILRDDFDGAETMARFGTVTRGDMQEYRLSQTLGRSWNTGNVLATYEFHDRASLTLADRPQIAAPSSPATGNLPDLDDFDLLPAQQRNSAVLALRQEIGGSAAVTASGLYSRREADSTTFGSGSTATTSNYQSRSNALSLSIGLVHDLPNGWAGTHGVTFGEVSNREVARNIAPVMSDPRLKNTDSEIWTGDLRFDGPLFSLPAGDILTAVGGHYREERFVNELVESGVNREADRSVAAAFGEVQIPLVGPSQGLPLIRRLELNLSGRYDDYSDYGARFSPKAGIVWQVAEGLRLRSSWSESFAPPPLGRVGDLGRTGAIMPYANILRAFNVAPPAPDLAGMNYLQVIGTASDLGPETSSTLTLGVDAEWSVRRHSFSLQSSYYDISFDGRLGTTPIPQNLNANLAPSLAFGDPGLFPTGTVIFYPSQDEIDAVISGFNLPPVFVGGVSSVTNIGIINNAFIVRNLASTQTRGLDVTFDYDTDLGVGRLKAGLNANYILDFRQQASVTSPVVDTLDTFLNPVALQLRGQLGYQRGGLTGNMYLNYRDRYRTDGSASAQPIKSWTTLDLSMTYAFEDDESWRSGLVIGINAINLLDSLPPVTPTNGVYRISGYDPTNANPLRRFVGIDIRKSF